MKKSLLFWLSVLLVLAFVPLKVDSQPAPLNFWQRFSTFNLVGPSTTDSVTKQTKQLPAGATPIESIVQNKTLSPTYYYRYQARLSAAEKAVFAEAVAVYNATGLVNLTPGNAKESQNSIEFFVYKKRSSIVQQGMIEAGHGGPKIIQRIGLGAYTANHARAGLNVFYAQYGAKLSVAIHELGHALGLDHSQSKKSVMYPVDQNVATLSKGDLRGLAAIYNNGK